MKKITAFLFASRIHVKATSLEFSELVSLPAGEFTFLGMNMD